MPIMEGDVTPAIQENVEAAARFHTGGAPARRDNEETQERFYPWICQAVVEMGYTDRLARKFIPAHDPMACSIRGTRFRDV